MAFCRTCGLPLEERAGFCSSCGSPGINTAGVGAAAATQVGTSTGIESNVAAALAYILGILTAVVFLAIDPYKHDRFVRFHAFQSLFFGLAWIGFWIAWAFLWGMLAYASGGTLFWIGLPLRMLCGLAGFLYWLFLMYKAYKNEMYKIPVIGELAAKQAG